MLKTYKYYSHEGKKPKNIVFFLHGYGSNGKNLLPLAKEFDNYIDTAIFLSPNAPFSYELNEPNDQEFQWFSLMDRSYNSLLEGAKKANDILEKYIENTIKEFDLKYQNIILIGFSQGTMMSLFSSIRMKEEIKGIIGFSGTMIAPDKLENDVISKSKICLIHGEDDDIVPLSHGRLAYKALLQNQFEVKFYEIKNLGHSIDFTGVEHAINFLKTI